MINVLWNYRQFIISSIRREISSRFARSTAGGLWMILNPLAQVAMYTVVLSAILGAKLPGIDNKFSYAIYLTSGILTWSLFSGIISQAVNLFTSNANLMKKIVFPKISLPIIVVGVELTNYFFLFVAVVFIYIVLNHFPGPELLWMIPISALIVALAMGLGLIAGILNVFIRDVGVALPVILQLGFWLTPIVYPVSILPEKLQSWIQFNPMYPIVEAVHDIMVYHQAPNFESLLYVFIISLICLIFGYFLFAKASAEMVDVL